MKRSGVNIGHFFYSTTILVILYFYIYNPVLNWPGFGFVAVLMPISLLYFVLEFKESKLYVRLYRKEFVLSIVCVLYLFVIYSINGTDAFSIASELIKYIICNVFVPIFLVKKIFSNKYSLDFFDSVILVGFIASLISCVALLYPSFNAFLRGIMTDRELNIGATGKQLDFRSFGFSGFLVSAYGYVQGLIAAYCILKFDKRHKYYIVCIITLVISVIINARTGVFPIILALIIVLLRNVRNLNFRYLFLLFVSVIILYYLLLSFLQKNEGVFLFLIDFFEQVDEMFIEGNVEDSHYYTMMKIPNSLLGIIFGEGRSLFGLSLSEQSDIGYVNQLFMGGLVFLSLLLAYEFIYYHNIRKRSSEKIYSGLFFLSILLFNYKGVAMYGSNPFTRLWALYYFILVHNVISPKKIKI